ncbi:hypothetical protein Aeh1ORF292c [Aeromonas phage Aeh1]|uniref:Uncharacterized protein n=1 Tax=Aeromonas phage Aeh1 TaxID=2880362 RepID=Q76YD4_9CAUD|nr:hypothetical protein Aeh1p311 [Aeromonas phage Aeh1]AAQ17961.1 hypothetical protein Aeh1ORF292c [Aeromonas phage Aeh1]
MKSMLQTLGTVLGMLAGMTFSQNGFELNWIIAAELVTSMACFYASHKAKS